VGGGGVACKNGRVTLSSIPVHPEPARRIRSVPDDWTVWAFTDVHGVLSGVAAALQQAGLVDAELRWIAPPGTALVGCGDYVDRGAETRRLLELLRRLQGEAAAAGGAVELARGNHELQLLQAANADPTWTETWLRYGGWPALESYGLTGTDDEVPGLLRRIDDVDPGVLAWLADLAEAIRWRDVLFVHGGLVPGGSLDDFGTTTDDHLYVRAPWFERAWDAEAFGRYEAAGVQRAVFGHSPQANGPRLFHGGRSIALDTNAGRNPTLPPDARVEITLLELRGDVAFADARQVRVPVDDAPDAVPPGTVAYVPGTHTG
jgi:hypothetical protein